MNRKIILAAALLLGISATAGAQSIRSNAHRENLRIEQGRRDGDLTRGEAFRLNREQQGIRKDIHRSRFNDGRIGPRERRNIRREERRHSRHIYRARHNRFNRFH